MPADRSAIPALSHPKGVGEDPLTHYTRVYLLFLQGLFAQFQSGQGCFYWSSDVNDTEISILDQAPIPRDRLEQRPALITMRGPAQFANLTLDQLRDINMMTGERSHTDLISCTMSINCLAKNGLEAQRIAWIVMRHIRIFKRLLQRNGGFHLVGQMVSIGPESPPGAMVEPDPDPSVVMVTVHSPFFFQWNEIIRPTNASLVNSISAHMTTNLMSADATGAGAIRPAGSVAEGIKSDGTVEGSEDVGAYGVNAGLGAVRSKIPTIRGNPINGVSVSIDGSQPAPAGSIQITVKV